VLGNARRDGLNAVPYETSTQKRPDGVNRPASLPYLTYPTYLTCLTYLTYLSTR